jgi:hypothetical protein
MSQKQNSKNSTKKISPVKSSSRQSSSNGSSSGGGNGNPHVVDVYIRDPQISNPKSIAEKYNLDYDPSDNEADDGEDEGGHDEDSLGDGTASGYNEEMLAKEISRHQGVQNQVNDLVAKLDAKNREIERLCVLLEAVSVVPGADPGRYIEIIDGGKEEIVVWFILLPSPSPFFCDCHCIGFFSFRIIATVKLFPSPRNVGI